MRLFLIFGVLLLIISGCKSNYDDLSNGLYNGNKLVVYGSIDNENGCIVKVSHSIQPVGIFSDSFEVKNAQIILYENGDSISSIIKGKQSFGGFAYTDSTIKPKVGARYKIKVRAEGYTTVESDEEVFLEKPEVRNTSFDFGQGEIFGDKFYVFRANLFFDSTKTHFFIINSLTENDTTATTSNLSTNLGNKYQICDAYLYRLTDFYGSSSCFYSGEEFKCNITFSKKLNYYTKRIPTVINLRVSAISKIYFDYNKSLNQPASPQDLNFKEPNTAVNNIKNGYGYFYTKNTAVFTKKI